MPPLIGRMVAMARQAAGELAATGVEAEVIDPRTTSPLDTGTILASVRKTGRLVVVDEASPRCNLATDISALVAKEAFGALRAPIEMVTPPHTPVPFSDALEDLYIPDAQKVLNAAKAAVEYRRSSPAVHSGRDGGGAWRTGTHPGRGRRVRIDFDG